MMERLDAASQATAYAYDANSNQTVLTDALGRVTTQAYDALDRLIRVTDPLGGVTTYAYDAQDRPISITDPRGLTTGYRYDGLGNRLQQDSPDTGLTAYRYDAAGNRLTQTDARGITTAYRYDVLNRRIAVHYPDSGVDVMLSYDQGAHGIGRLSAMRDARGSTEYRYDARGNLIDATNLIQGKRYSTQYRYDLADKLIQIRYPSGRTVDYARNPAGVIRAVSTAVNASSEPLAEAIAYAPFGGLATLTYGNGLRTDYRYDLDGRLSSLSTAPVRAHEYSYDALGNITAITDTLAPAGSQTFAYDALDRLLGETGPYGARDYSYDALGNRTQQIVQDLRFDAQGQPVTRSRTQDYIYEEQANRLVRINRKPHSYDAAGNLISDRDARRQFSYDDSGRLSTFTRRGALKASYRYDGKGRRVVKLRHTAKGQQATHFHYAPNGRLLAETVYNHKGIKKTVREYLWLDNTPLTQIRTRYRNNGKIKGMQKVYLHSDHLNTPRYATDAQQRIVWRWRGDAFGQGRAETDPDGDGSKVNVRLRFPGQYWDAESGLHYNYFRDYDPNTGRYIESDPIGLSGGINTYAYVSNRLGCRNNGAYGYTNFPGFWSPVPLKKARRCLRRV
jgi:RHS repeat-associated protein